MVSTVFADGGFSIDGDDGLPAYVNAAEATRSGVSLRPGDRLEYSILLGAAAFDVMPVAAPAGSAGEPQVDDRHLLDGVAKASERTADDAAGSLMAGITAAAMV
jgi:hypothetical protein